MNLSIILVVFLIASTMAVLSCTAAAICKECYGNVLDDCYNCFNWKLGTVGPRYLSGLDCKNTADFIINCKIYSETLLAASTLVTDACRNVTRVTP
jgi:hypothetical protein